METEVSVPLYRVALAAPEDARWTDERGNVWTVVWWRGRAWTVCLGSRRALRIAAALWPLLA